MVCPYLNNKGSAVRFCLWPRNEKRNNNRTKNHGRTLSFALNKEFYEDFLLSGFKKLVLDDDLYSQIEKFEKITYIIASSPKKIYFEMNNFVFKNNKFERISRKIDKTSFIDPTSFVDNNVQIGSNVHIGKNCSIYKNTIIESGTHIGNYASTGIGTVVTSDLKSNKFKIGNPGWIIQ